MNNDFHKEDYDEKEDNTDPIIGKVFFSKYKATNRSNNNDLFKRTKYPFY